MENLIIAIIPLIGFFIILNKYIKLKSSNSPFVQDKKMNLEIERKFLIEGAENLPSDLAQKSSVFELKQSYISYSPEIRLRNADNKNFIFTLKTKADNTGLIRNEIEFPISKDEYFELEPKTDQTPINKTRYHYNHNGLIIVVDIYKNKLNGLITAEIEFETVEKANEFVPLPWFSKEVTHMPEYKNANLSRNS